MDNLCLKRGFPFDDDVMPGKSKLKDHLEDLAKRHPELADQLKDWTDIERSPKIPRASSGGLGGQEATGGNAEQQSRVQQQQPPAEDPSGQGPSKAPNLRATVPDMQAQQEKMDQQQRNQRSQSAPPEGPPVKGQFSSGHAPTSETNSTQQSTNDPNHDQQQPHQNSQQQNQSQQSQQSQGRSNERYIPIFVEGRGETIVNVPVQNDKAQPPPQTQTPPPRQKKAAYQKTPPPANPASSAPQPSPAAPAPSPQPAPSQEAIPPPQPAPQQASAPPPQAPRPPSPLSQVANIQKEVDELRQRVDAFKGAKTDKEYVYLDEMLTRNLLKLDNIDSEGKEEVRAARKEVIRSIQQCINKLETAPNNNNP